MGAFDRLWKAISEALFGDAGEAEPAGTESARERARDTRSSCGSWARPAPARPRSSPALTGDPRAEVGQGFEPCTRTAAFYDVPPEAPLLRFLDTRGLGEANYDPANDISWCEEQSHLMLVVMQVSDPVQHAVLQRRCSRRAAAIPSGRWWWRRPACTAFIPPGRGIRRPIPSPAGRKTKRKPPLPHALRQALAHQRQLFDGLRGPRPRFVPVDFTVPEDGFPPHDFGLEMLSARPAGGRPHAFEALHARAPRRRAIGSGRRRVR